MAREEMLIVNVDGERILMTVRQYDALMAQWVRNRMGSSEKVRNQSNSRLADLARRGRR